MSLQLKAILDRFGKIILNLTWLDSHRHQASNTKLIIFF
jgi:hypothetical protein